MAARGRGRDSAKEVFWRKVVDGFVPGRSTVRAWCLKHSVSEPSFYAWRRELKRRDTGAARVSARLLRVKVAPASERTSPKVIIELSGGTRLHIDIDHLIEVLDVLEARSC